MVTEIIIGNQKDLKKDLEVYDLFQSRANLALDDYAITKLSVDESKVLIYTDLDEENLHILMMILIDLNYTVYKVQTRTPNYAKKLYWEFQNDENDYQIVKRFIQGGKKIIFPSSHVVKMNPTKKPAINWLSNICWN